MSEARSKRPAYLTYGLAALAGSSVPAYLQYRFGNDGAFWAGAPLALVGAGLLIRAALPEKDANEEGGALAGVTFREISAGMSILAMVAVYGYFTVKLFDAPATVGTAVGALIGSTVLLTAVLVASHIVAAVARRPEMEDERDRDIALLSVRNSHWVLAVGIWLVLFLALLQSPPTIIAYAAMGVFVVSELARLGSSIIYYRTAL